MQRASSVVFLALTGLTLMLGARADAATDAEVQKSLKKMIGAIRYGKDDIAAKQVAFEAMSERLMAGAWDKMTPVQQQEFRKNLEGLVRGISFKRGHEMFQHLDAVLYDSVVEKGNEAHCKSTVVVHRNYKKTEIVIEYVLLQNGGQWKVVDLIMLGDSTVQGLREDQIEPLMAKGGVEAVLQAMRDKLADIG